MKNLLNKESKQAYDLLKKALDSGDIELSEEDEDDKNLSLKELNEKRFSELLS